jgi:hypothetical protein
MRRELLVNDLIPLLFTQGTYLYSVDLPFLSNPN